jgi:hypothetical protein
MPLFLRNNYLRHGFVALLVLGLAAFASAQSQQYAHDSSASSQVQSGETADVTDVIRNPDNYAGKEVTVKWKIDHVYSPTTIGLEKDEKHLLVVKVGTGPFPAANMKQNEPVTFTGTVRKFDQEALERDYGKMDFGNAPLKKIHTVLIVGEPQSAKLEQPQVAEPENPPAPEAAPPAQPEAVAPEAPAPVEHASNQPEALPRTASPLPLFGFAGVMFLLLGLSIPLLRRQ